jgi:anti-sigma B factor antagonist
LEEAVKTHPSEIVVDMAELTFIDSSGLNALIFAERMLRENGGHLVLSDPPRSALRVLEVSGLNEVFRRANSRQGAHWLRRSAHK